MPAHPTSSHSIVHSKRLPTSFYFSNTFPARTSFIFWNSHAIIMNQNTRPLLPPLSLTLRLPRAFCPLSTRPDIGRRTSNFPPSSYRDDSNGANTAAWGEFDYKKSGCLSSGSEDRDYLLVCSLRCDVPLERSIDLPSRVRPPTLPRNSMQPLPPFHIPSIQNRQFPATIANTLHPAEWFSDLPGHQCHQLFLEPNLLGKPLSIVFFPPPCQFANASL